MYIPFNVVNFVVILQIKFTVIHSEHYKLKNKIVIILLFIASFQGKLVAQIDTVPKPLSESLVIPITLVTAGLIAQGPISRDIRGEILRSFPNFHTKADDYLAVVPTCIPIAMSVLGIKGKHELKDQIILTILSHSLSMGITNGLKYAVAYPRPDGVGMESFPSGHTTLQIKNELF